MGEKMIIRLFIFLCFFIYAGNVSHAEIMGDDAFADLNWELLYEEQVTGIVQSICATEDYIITIENIADNATDNDIVSAYYKNDVDEHGNPVEQYTLAKRVSATCWEHGNGMAYNSNTREIYVALYTNYIPENRGCIYVMDPDTLAYKRTIKISDDYNILGIAYKEDTNQYVIQTNIDGGYSFKILDENFNIVEDLGEYAEVGMGCNFQDMVVDGDYILNFPLTLGMGIGDYLHVYSISRKALITAPQIDFRFENITGDEPESLCEIEPGVYLAAVDVVDTEGIRKTQFYRVEIPYYFYVNVADNLGNTMTQQVLRGEDFMINCTSEAGYELGGIVVNNEELFEARDKTEDRGGYLIQNIRENQNVELKFEESLPLDFSQEMVANPLVIKKKFFSVSMIGSIAGIGCVIIIAYIYYMHVRMERRRKALRARRRRQQYMVGI